MFYLFYSILYNIYIFLQGVQGAGRPHPDAPSPAVWRPDAPHDDAQPHDPQPHGDGRGRPGGGRALAPGALNSDLSPLDAPARSTARLAARLAVQYVDQCALVHFDFFFFL